MDLRLTFNEDAANDDSMLYTYSDHRAMPAEKRRRFYRDMAAAINGNGCQVFLLDTIDLYLARKKSPAKINLY